MEEEYVPDSTNCKDLCLGFFPGSRIEGQVIYLWEGDSGEQEGRREGTE